MYVSVIDVSQEVTKQTKNGSAYTEIEVTYKDADGKVKPKKLNSLGRDAGVKKVYATFKDAKKGDTFEVTSVKEGDYWNWKDVAPAATSVASSATSSGSAQGTVAGRSSSYETSEERAARQVLIVKQSSLANAIAYHGQGKSQVSDDKVLETAQKFTDWVMGVGMEGLPKDSLEQEFDGDVPN